MIAAAVLVEESRVPAFPAVVPPLAEPDLLEQEIRQANAAWADRWRKHCTACNGWGGFSAPLADARSGGFAWCTALGAGQCHRCGEHGLSAEGEGPCSVCGWNYDNGMEDLVDLA